MTKTVKQQSSPSSTGGLGNNFETRVQAAFTVLLLSGQVAPCLPPSQITKLKLQSRYAGFNTDDLIVFAKQLQSGQEIKLLAQIKHNISITAGKKNKTFADVIHSAWNDFHSENFNPNADAFALITGPLSATDIDHVRPILEWARHSETEEEFLLKINSPKFSSGIKRIKLEAFKTHLKAANGGNDVSDRRLWEFLKVFHLIGYDLDTESGGTLSLLQSLISLHSNKTPSLLWARVIDAVQIANQNAGTISLVSCQ